MTDPTTTPLVDRLRARADRHCPSPFSALLTAAAASRSGEDFGKFRNRIWSRHWQFPEVRH